MELSGSLLKQNEEERCEEKLLWVEEEIYEEGDHGENAESLATPSEEDDSYDENCEDDEDCDLQSSITELLRITEKHATKSNVRSPKSIFFSFPSIQRQRASGSSDQALESSILSLPSPPLTSPKQKPTTELLPRQQLIQDGDKKAIDGRDKFGLGKGERIGTCTSRQLEEEEAKMARTA